MQLPACRKWPLQHCSPVLDERQSSPNMVHYAALSKHAATYAVAGLNSSACLMLERLPVQHPPTLPCIAAAEPACMQVASTALPPRRRFQCNLISMQPVQHDAEAPS